MDFSRKSSICEKNIFTIELNRSRETINRNSSGIADVYRMAKPYNRLLLFDA